MVGSLFPFCSKRFADGCENPHRTLVTDRSGPNGTLKKRVVIGRLARGIRNRFLDRYSAAAPVAYPEVHYLTAPMRQAGRAAGDAGVVNLWAGQTYELGRPLPAGQLVRALAEEARAALHQAQERLGSPADAEGRGLGRRAPLSDPPRPRHSPSLAPLLLESPYCNNS